MQPSKKQQEISPCKTHTSNTAARSGRPRCCPEFADLLPPLTEEQLDALEKDIIANGCYAPVIVNEDMVVIDGHNRKSICEKHDIRDAINGNLAAIEAGQRPILAERPRYRPYPKHRKYSGFLALYVHYLYVLGKIEKRAYPPRMALRLRSSLMRFDRYREQFAFLRENGITTQSELDAFAAKTEERVAVLTKQRTILNVRKKKRQAQYTALADAEALAPARECCESGLTGLEDEYARYTEAVETLNACGISRERLAAEKAALYEELAGVNRAIRAEWKKLRLCAEITGEAPRIEREAWNMNEQNEMQLFEDPPIRTAWDAENEEWLFSVVDVVGVLTEQPDYDGARNYWKVLILFSNKTLQFASAYFPPCVVVVLDGRQPTCVLRLA